MVATDEKNSRNPQNVQLRQQLPREQAKYESLSTIIRPLYSLAAFVNGLVTLVASLLAALTAWLAWSSTSWPLIGDATIFHFIAVQMSLGAAPYRDLIDMNMPLTYWLHAAIIAVGGMGDWPFRLFDLGLSTLIGALAATLVWPAGRGLGLIAALTIVSTHLMLGPLQPVNEIIFFWRPRSPLRFVQFGSPRTVAAALPYSLPSEA